MNETFYILLRWTGCACLLAFISQTALAAMPQVIPTRQNVFSIPFSMPAATDPMSQPVEVQLHVSTNGGRSWQLYHRQSPHVNKFQFRAANDGEYLFASRTIDRQGRAKPAGTFQPELRVVIDTTSPQLDLIASVGPAGELETSWRVNDPNLEIDTFRIYYRYENRQPWQPVAVDLPPAAVHKTTLSGQTTWWPPKHGQTVSIRAEVADSAGNINVVNRQLDLPRVANNRQTPLVSTQNPFERSRERSSDSRPESRRSDGMSQGAVAWPPDQVAQGNSPSSLPERSWPEAQTSPLAPPIGNRVALEPAEGDSPYDNLPPDAIVQMTRHDRFYLDYDVQAVGPSGIARVEVWVTKNGGRLWQKLSEDDDLESPALIEAPGAGVYGFRIVVQSNNGLIGDLPRSGDPAEVWIGIDQTLPTCEITSASYGHGDQAGVLNLTWRANDARLGARPISLLFSDQPQGPWTSIAANLENTGSYAWKIHQRVPEYIYLRLEVTDEAGNIAHHQLTQPVANDGLVPRGRILRIQPAP